MTSVQAAVNDWMEKNGPMMVNCPRQPGKLLISKSACSKRRQKAKVQDYVHMMEGSFMDYVHKMGLYICLQCPGEEQNS